MNNHLRVFILLAIVVVVAIDARKSRTYKTCFQNKCQNTTRNWKCCHLGVRLAKRSYSCSVDGVISTEKYLRSLKHNIHSKTTLPKNRLFRKVRQCKRFEVCLHCCCMQQKQRMFRHRKMSNRG